MGRAGRGYRARTDRRDRGRGPKEPEALIVDLSRVDFLASAGMTVLIAAHREVAPSARFGVVADGPATSRPLKIIGIDTIVDVYRTLDDALNEFA